MNKCLLLITAMLFSFATNAADFREGRDYQLLKTPASAQPQVTEYFSFFCPHCYGFESVIEQVKEKLPKDVAFNKVHVSFMGGSMGIPVAKSYATMVVLDVEDKMMPVMFRQIQELRQAPQNEAQIRQLFIDNGVDGKQFDAAYNSFVVNSMQNQFDKGFKDSRLSGVPSVVVNNKYHLTPQNISTIDEYVELVNYLLEK